MDRRRLISACTALLLCLQSVSAQDPEVAQIKERELEAVRERISALKRSMDRRAIERDRITGELQAAEVSIGERRLALADLERQRAYSERRKVELDAEAEEKQADLERQAASLSAQVRAAYMNGRRERVRLLLSQRDPAELGRAMTYYRYFSDYRASEIAAVTATLEALEKARADAAAEAARLTRLEQSRSRELEALETSQMERRTLLASLNRRIAEEGSEVERLAAQERDLSRLIEELQSILSDYPISSEAPFSELRGRLTWPVAGALIHDFGQPRATGELRWNGVVLNAPRGREVRAVYHGRVAFADWLAGMGLLVIVDHGEGYLTLYGYNETTLKIAGEWVAPGDVIATVGESGGQPQPALYFELRKGKTPIDPRSWFKRQPRS